MLRLPHALLRELPRYIGPLGRFPLARTAVSWLVINQVALSTSPRPRALSMLADYTSWKSLTDRSFSGRHLPPVVDTALPTEAEVVALFRRSGGMTPSTAPAPCSCSSRSGSPTAFCGPATPTTARTPRRRRSTCARSTASARIRRACLRADSGGELKSQLINGEEYAEFLFASRAPGARPTVKPEFAGLHDDTFIVDTILDGASEAQKDNFFAVGLEHGNSTIGSTLLKVVFLREHNRIARTLAAEHAGDPSWDNDRLFETTRNIMIVLLLNLVVEEYIRHISPGDFPIQNVSRSSQAGRVGTAPTGAPSSSTCSTDGTRWSPTTSAPGPTCCTHATSGTTTSS